MNKIDDYLQYYIYLQQNVHSRFLYINILYHTNLINTNEKCSYFYLYHIRTAVDDDDDDDVFV